MAAAPIFRAQSGEVRGNLFENLRVGVPRGVYWCCNIDFLPERASAESPADEASSCTLLCDWIAWPIRSWREISGLTLANCTRPLGVEACLYFGGEHQLLSIIELAFEHAYADRFRVHGRFAGDLLDARGEMFRAAGAEFTVEVRLTGVSVLPDNLFPPPKSVAQVLAALGAFADLGSYEQPSWEEICWLFRPKVGAATSGTPIHQT